MQPEGILRHGPYCSAPILIVPNATIRYCHIFVGTWMGRSRCVHGFPGDASKMRTPMRMRSCSNSHMSRCQTVYCYLYRSFKSNQWEREKHAPSPLHYVYALPSPRAHPWSCQYTSNTRVTERIYNRYNLQSLHPQCWMCHCIPIHREVYLSGRLLYPPGLATLEVL